VFAKSQVTKAKRQKNPKIEIRFSNLNMGVSLGFRNLACGILFSGQTRARND
jgi:hypothetical protein